MSISIPTGTIKSPIPNHQYKLYVRISIPTGTIKRKPWARDANRRIAISIPTGTIKRQWHKYLCFKDFISIPTGTIKSCYGSLPPDPFPRFQFLLVRLKVESVYALPDIALISIPTGTIKRITVISSVVSFNIISIPTGTIKRVLGHKHRPKKIPFQFPTGTIKRDTTERRLLSRLYANFNSYWYD